MHGFVYVFKPVKTRKGVPPPLSPCPMDLKLCRVHQGGLSITFKPKKSQPSTYGCHKRIMKIGPKTAFCRDFRVITIEFSYPASTKPA